MELWEYSNFLFENYLLKYKENIKKEDKTPLQAANQNEF